jgi:hypothetical protein
MKPRPDLMSHLLLSFSQETEEVYEVDGTFVHRSRMMPLPGAGIAEQAGLPGVPLKAPAQVLRQSITRTVKLHFAPSTIFTLRKEVAA